MQLIALIMDIMYLLVPISVLLVFFIGFLFWWALNNRQFDHLDEVSTRLLNDNDTPTPSHKENHIERPSE
jgi:cbb3-type cytochrome oxidase maturation protein